MTKLPSRHSLLPLGKRSALFLLVSVLSFATVLHAFTPQTASAIQLSPRKVTISSSRGAATGVQYDFTFSWSVASDIEGVIFQFCQAPLGACTLPPSMDVTHDNVTLDGQAGFPNNGTAFSEVTSNTGDCSDTASTMYCINRTEGTSATGSAATIDLGGIVNPTLSSAFTTVYVRISMYNNNTFNPASSGRVHDGTVAAGITQQLTTTGRVQERLSFCVAAIDDDDATPADCSAFPTTTSIDLGVIDNTALFISPVEPTATNGSNDDYGVAMVNTNASSGVAVTYYPEAATNVAASDTHQLRTFRVLPTDCSATTTSSTDQCFISASNAGENFAAATERFGIYIPCVDGSQGTTTQNLSNPANGATINAAYSGTDAAITDVAPGTCEADELASNVKFGFDDSGTPDDLVASNTVVDDEMIKIGFAAAAAATTPTGTYFVVTTYIATPTF